MLLELVKTLICPVCLPQEIQLSAQIKERNDSEIIEGKLLCPACGRPYPINDGLADLRPEPPPEAAKSSRYESRSLLSSYLWTHFGDWLEDPLASSAYRDWAFELTAAPDGIGLDIGCAVGRMTLEMRRKCRLTIGLDYSYSFIRAARNLIKQGSSRLRLPDEGQLGHEKELALPADQPRDRIEFIVADAQALPFKSTVFSIIAGLNLVDKLPRPLKHLEECHRVARRDRAQLLLSDPFSWSTEVTAPENWLGGTEAGDFAGYGLDNIRQLLSHKFSPAWRIATEDQVWWKIRTHRNHYELIRSCFIKAEQGNPYHG